jgi:hypothetical protein
MPSDSSPLAVNENRAAIDRLVHVEQTVTLDPAFEGE